MPESANPPPGVEKKITLGRLLLWPMIALLLASVVIRFGDLDLQVARAVYSDQGEWTYGEQPWVLFLYEHGPLPSIVVASIGALVWLASCFTNRLRRQRPMALFLALTMLLGPGLLVNAAFKGYWGRPRPKQITEFGGEMKFAPLGQSNLGQKGRSFPSGHASTGFYWLVLGVYFINQNRRLAIGFLTLGLVHGTFMGTGRIFQGAHWLSDVMWAGGMDYLSAFIVLHLVPAARPVSISTSTDLEGQTHDSSEASS